MEFLNMPLVSWVNGTIMIGVFALVVIGITATVIILASSDKKTEE